MVHFPKKLLVNFFSLVKKTKPGGGVAKDHTFYGVFFGPFFLCIFVFSVFSRIKHMNINGESYEDLGPKK
jgi:hypothetical protein